jgi:hypothetical protein
MTIVLGCTAYSLSEAAGRAKHQYLVGLDYACMRRAVFFAESSHHAI